MPNLDRPIDLLFRPEGWLAERLRANEANWLIPLPAMNPGVVEMFATRDQPEAVNAVPWAGEFAGKYLIGVVQSLRLTGNAELEHVAQQFVTKLLATQGSDGSLGMPLAWDLWGQYHVMLGLLRWHEHTGHDLALEACKRAADLACARYLDHPSRIASDNKGDDEKNQAIAHVLVLLFERTGVQRYLDLARAIEAEWSSLRCFDRVDHGKVVRCGNFVDGPLAGRPYCDGTRNRWEGLHDVQAIAELYFITADARYRTALTETWWNIRTRDRHVTGGFTSFEAATGSPYDPRYIETCGTVAWMALTVDMLRVSGDSRAGDELELSLFNAIMGAQSSDGRHWTYHTPMGGIPIGGTPNPAAVLGYRYPAYYDLAWQAHERYPQLSCCSANGPRGLGCVSEWAVMRASDAIVVNYYGQSTASLAAPDGPQVTLAQETAYPIDGVIRITVTPSRPAVFSVRLRIPEWSSSSHLDVNGAPQPCAAGSYAEIRRLWQADDVITLKMDMSVRVVAGLQEAWGYSAAYRGPLLLAFDTRFGAFDPLALPSIDLKSPAFVGPGSHGAALVVSFPSTSGQVSFCDFASAGQAPGLPARPDTSGIWQFARSDGTILAEQISLLNDGSIQGYSHPNEARWGFDGDTLTFSTSGGEPSTRFSFRIIENGKQILSGMSLIAANVRHILSEVDLGIVDKTWQFWREQPDKEILRPTVRLLANGTFDVPMHANETRWGMEGDVLVFFDASDAPSTRFSSLIMKNGRVQRSGVFLSDNSIRHVLSEVDLNIEATLWTYSEPDKLPFADKVRLLATHGLDGYHDDNEARWALGNTRETLAFIAAGGAVSTRFDTFSAANGRMRFQGKMVVDPSITHVLQESAPGWTINSSYVAWVPRPRLGAWAAFFPSPSPVSAISTRPGGTSLYAVGLDEGHGGGRVWSKFFPDPENPAQWTGWFTLGDNVFRPGSPVTAFSTGPGATSLYVIGLDGQIWTNFFPSASAGQWSGWMPLGPNVFPLNSTVAALSTRPGGTSLFVVGLDEGHGGGRTWTKFFPDPANPTQWTGWFPLGDNVFRPGSPVTALSTGSGATGLYVIGLDGHIWTNFFPSASAGQWSGWMPLGPNVFPLMSTVTAISTRPGGTSLYVVGLDEGHGGGRVWSKFFPDPANPTQWTGWFPLGDNVFRPGSPVTALSTGPGATSLYVVGLDGQVWTNFFPSANAGQWSGWMPLGPNVFPIASTIATISTKPGGTSLYVVGFDEDHGGRVWGTFFPDENNPTQWAAWFPL
jgi:DUF1680 family protein